MRNGKQSQPCRQEGMQGLYRPPVSRTKLNIQTNNKDVRMDLRFSQDRKMPYHARGKTIMQNSLSFSLSLYIYIYIPPLSLSLPPFVSSLSLSLSLFLFLSRFLSSHLFLTGRGLVRSQLCSHYCSTNPYSTCSGKLMPSCSCHGYASIGLR